MGSEEAAGIAVIGIAGYARSHLESIRRLEQANVCRLRAVVVRPEDSEPEREAEFSADGVKVYRSVEEMLVAERRRVEIVTNPTGIPAHEPLSVAALTSGYNVLCEKPVAGTVAAARSMDAAAKAHGKVLGIGFQYIYSTTIQRIKRIRVDRVLGRLTGAKTIALWPRTTAYYERNGWAGKLSVGDTPVYDSPAQNATSHHFHAMLYVAGTGYGVSALPRSLYGENYRAKDIESADTQFVRVVTRDGVEIVHICSHAVRREPELRTEYRFERGTITLHVAGGRNWYTAASDDGAVVKELGDIDGAEEDSAAVRASVFRNMVHAARSGGVPLCTVENSLVHTFCIERLFSESAPVVDVDPSYVDAISVAGPDGRTAVNKVVRGLEDLAESMYSRAVGFAEAGAPWAKSGRLLTLEDPPFAV